MAWELSAQRPIWSQLVEQIQLRIVTGRYPAGSRLPSVRELAADATVNPNTMQRALSQLEADGLVCSQRTSGRFVTEQEETIMELKKTLAKNLVRDFLTRIEALGYTAKEAAQLLEAEDAAQFRTKEDA